MRLKEVKCLMLKSFQKFKIFDFYLHNEINSLVAEAPTPRHPESPCDPWENL